MFRGAITFLGAVPALLSHFLHLGLPLFLTIIIFIATLGAIMYPLLAKQVGHPIALITTLVVFTAASIASWPSIIQFVKDKIGIPDSDRPPPPQPPVPQNPPDAAGPPLIPEPPGPPSPPFSKDEAGLEKYYYRKARVDFLLDAYHGSLETKHVFTNKNVSLRFVCPTYGQKSSEYWLAYTINAKSQPDWYLIEYYSDGRKSDPLYSRLMPRTNYPPKEIESLTAYQSNVRAKIFGKPSSWVTRVDIISNKTFPDEFISWKSNGKYVVASIPFDSNLATMIYHCILRGSMR